MTKYEIKLEEHHYAVGKGIEVPTLKVDGKDIKFPSEEYTPAVAEFEKAARELSQKLKASELVLIIER